MAFTSKSTVDFIAANDPQLLKTRRAILAKLRAHFGDYVPAEGRAAQRNKIKALKPKPKA